MQAAITTSGLGRSFGRTVAVDRLDLQVPLRQVTGFLGPNGAGKSTTIRLILGLLRPSCGSARILGLDLAANRRAIARRVGAMVDMPCHYDHLTGHENLSVTARLLGEGSGEIARVLAMVDLAKAAARRVGGYSLGMRQRLGIARALLGRPELLILDEPTNGLDPDGIIDIRGLLRRLPAEARTTVFVSSHLLAEVEQTVDHVALVARGRLIAQGPLASLLGTGSPRIRVAVADPAEGVALLARHGIAATHIGEDELDLPAGGNASASAINALLVEHGIAVSRLRSVRPSLEQAYLQLVGGTGPAREATR